LNTALKTYAAAAIFGGTFWQLRRQVSQGGGVRPADPHCFEAVCSRARLARHRLRGVGTLGIARLFYVGDQKKAAK